MGEAVIIEAVRTPIGRNRGTLRDVRPDVLYSHVLNEVVKRAGLSPDKVEDVVTGCVSQASEQGANIGRLAVMLSDLPRTVPAVSLNRMCGSSQQAIHFASQAVAAGDVGINIGGGVESMTRVPMFSDVGDLAKLNPQLFKKYEIVHQGESSERIADKWGLSREDLDKFSVESHLRAAKATKEGRFASQIHPVQGQDADGNPVTLQHDEGIRFEPDVAKMTSLKAVFRPDGKTTAANSSQISDGAAAVLIADRELAKAEGLKPRARFRARVAVAGDPTLQLAEVIPATQKALRKAGLSMKEIDVVEINEAFATVVLAWAKELQADMEKVNPNGGAIAHGHPLGGTGAILMTKLLNELERSGGQFGLQVMCIGHGMATATIIERI